MTDSVAFERPAPSGGPVLRALLFVLPLAIALGYIAALDLFLPATFFAIAFVGMIGYLATPLGAEFWVPTTVLAVQAEGGGGFYAFWAVGSIVLVDWFIALFMLWNFDLAERAPFLGASSTRRRHAARSSWTRNLGGGGSRSPPSPSTSPSPSR